MADTETELDPVSPTQELHIDPTSQIPVAPQRGPTVVPATSTLSSRTRRASGRAGDRPRASGSRGSWLFCWSCSWRRSASGPAPTSSATPRARRLRHHPLAVGHPLDPEGSRERASSGSGGSGGFPGLPSNATSGTVTDIVGNTLYVTDSSGKLVAVTVTSNTTVNRNAKSSLSSLQPGDSVTVQGTKSKNGTVSASSVSATQAGVSSGFSGLGALGAGSPNGSTGG